MTVPFVAVPQLTAAPPSPCCAIAAVSSCLHVSVMALFLSSTHSALHMKTQREVTLIFGYESILVCLWTEDHHMLRGIKTQKTEHKPLLEVEIAVFL